MLTNSTLQPVLTKIAVAMLQEPKDFVGLTLFPLFRTELLSSTYWVVDPAAMVTAQPNMPRSPGTPFARSLTKLGSDVYNTEQYAHEESMGREENAKYARPGAAVPSAAVATAWTDVNSDPIGDVAAARQQIFNASSMDANVMTVAWTVYEVLKRHPKIQAIIKISDGDSRWPALLAALFDVDKFAVAKGAVNMANEGQAFSLSEVWAANVVLAHVDSTEDLQAPSFGRTFIVTDEESPDGISVETYDEEVISSLAVRALQHTAEKLTGAALGYRLYGVLG
jgi:hypothetical protein